MVFLTRQKNLFSAFDLSDQKILRNSQNKFVFSFLHHLYSISSPPTGSPTPLLIKTELNIFVFCACLCSRCSLEAGMVPCVHRGGQRELLCNVELLKQGRRTHCQSSGRMRRWRLTSLRGLRSSPHVLPAWGTCLERGGGHSQVFLLP